MYCFHHSARSHLCYLPSSPGDCRKNYRLMTKFSHSLSLRLLLFVAVLLLLVVTGLTALAQNDDNRAWSDPINISASGAASAPSLAQDSSGTYHLFWLDAFAGASYASGDGNTWTEPVSPRFPFSEPPFGTTASETFEGFFAPSVYVDGQDRVQALWLNDDDELFYSRAAVADITAEAAGWTGPRLMARNVLQYEIVGGANGRLHMLFLTTANTATTQAGLVYRYSDDGGEVWSEPINVYASDYYRTIAETEANFHAMKGEGDNLFVVWDNRDLDTVFVARSTDNGISWEAPRSVDQRVDGDPLDAVGPSLINLSVSGSNVNLTWRASHEVEQCAQYVQQSNDNGTTWQAVQQVHEGTTSCPTGGRFIQATNGLLLLAFTRDNEVFMQAQDGTEWSRITAQTPLARFTDPVTFRVVQFGCYQMAVTVDNRLLVIGCGDGNDDDIWQISRPLGSIENWSSRFVPTSVWSQPVAVATSSVQILQPNVVTAADGRMHVFWSQSENPAANGRIVNPQEIPGHEILYSRFEAGVWAAPRPVLSSPNGTQADFPSVAADDQGSLFVAWAGNQPNGIYFSRSAADRASSVTEWTVPQFLPVPRESATWPSVVSNGDNNVYVVYTIPLNADRGIYLTRSEDDGDSWSDAIAVFDGETANWEVVGPAQLARSGDGTLHLLWTRWSQLPEMQAVALAYSRSEDDGQTWSSPEVVTQEPILGSSILAVEERFVHRIWTGLLDGRPVVWHQFSDDGGITWGERGRVVDPALIPGPTTLIADGTNTPLILQLAQNNADQLLLQEWVWTTDRWVASEQRVMDETAVDADTISAVAGPDGQIAVLFGSLFANGTTVRDQLIYTSRQGVLTDAAVTQTPLPTLTPTPEVLPTETPMPQPSPTATATLAPVQNLSPLNSNIGGIIVGVLVALLLVGAIFVIGWRIVRSR